MYCVNVPFTMAEQADHLHHDNVPTHSTALVQAFSAKHHIIQVCRHPYSPHLAFPKAKVAVQMEKICECDGHTVHKLSQRRLTADFLAPRDSDCSLMSSKVSSDWLPSYIKATRPIFEIFKMAGYFPDSPRRLTSHGPHSQGKDCHHYSVL